MADEEGPVSDWLKRAARSAGRRYGEIRESYREGRGSPDDESPDGTADEDSPGEPADDAANEYADLPAADLDYLPRNEDGDARLVCRRHAEKRAVGVDDAGRPACFDPEHPDCQGCVEDVRDGVVETW